MKKKLLFLFVLISISLGALQASKKPFTLVIDAGHGGKDTGAAGAISKEKDINLTVALAFGQLIERNSPDIKVIYTRKTDVFIPLMERANIANKNKADLFISVHTNALPAGRIAKGFETYTLGMHRASSNLDVAKRENSVILVEKDYKQTYQGFDPRSAESYIMFELIQSQNMTKSVELAKLIQRNVCLAANCADKGVHQAGFLVLRETSMPSCLVELGFITTADEEQALNSKPTVDAIASGLYKALLAYKAKYDSSISVPYKKHLAQDTSIPSVLPQGYEPVKDEERAIVAKEIKPEPVPMMAQKADTVPAKKVEVVKEKPVFKVQFLSSNRKLRADDQHLKGLTNYEYYEEGNALKYTYGASSNYYEISSLRKQVIDKFPQAFIVAFRGTEKMNINDAIKEFQNNNK